MNPVAADKATQRDGRSSARDARAAAGAEAPPAEDPRQLAVQFDILQRQLQAVDRRLTQLEQALVEAQQAASAVAALAEAKGPQESLIPIGSGVHLKATLDPATPVLLPVGAGYFTEGPAADVVSALQERVTAITRSFQQASEDAERMAQAAAAINQRIESLSPQ